MVLPARLNSVRHLQPKRKQLSESSQMGEGASRFPQYQMRHPVSFYESEYNREHRFVRRVGSESTVLYRTLSVSGYLRGFCSA